MPKCSNKIFENWKVFWSLIYLILLSQQAPEVEPEGLNELMDLLKSQVYVPQRDSAGPFVCAVDHCFSIKGQGTVMTGTILSGSVSVNDVGCLWDTFVVIG